MNFKAIKLDNKQIFLHLNVRQSEFFTDLILLFYVLFSLIFIISLVKNNKIIFSLLIVLGLTFILRLVIILQDNFLHEWDERYHACVAKNLLNHPFLPTLYEDNNLFYNNNDWTQSNIWLAKPIIPLWGMSAMIKLFGVDEVRWLRVPSLILSLCSGLIIFLIGISVVNKKTSILATFFYAIHGLSIENASGRFSSDVADTFFLFFGYTAIYFFILFGNTDNLKFLLLAAFFSSLAFLSKWIAALLVILVGLMILALNNKLKLKNIIIIFTIFFIIPLPWLFYLYKKIPNEFLTSIRMIFSVVYQNVNPHQGNSFYYLDKMRIVFGELIYIVFLFLIYKKFYKNKNILMLLLWISIPIFFMSLMQMKRINYMLISAPAFFLLSAFTFFYFYDNSEKNISNVMRLIVILLLILLPVRYMAERMKFFQLKPSPHYNVSALKKFKSFLKNQKNVVIFNSKFPIETMFHTGFPAYSFKPDSIELLNLKNKGYQCIILNK